MVGMSCLEKTASAKLLLAFLCLNLCWTHTSLLCTTKLQWKQNFKRSDLFKRSRLQLLPKLQKIALPLEWPWVHQLSWKDFRCFKWGTRPTGTWISNKRSTGFTWRVVPFWDDSNFFTYLIEVQKLGEWPRCSYDFLCTFSPVKHLSNTRGLLTCAQNAYCPCWCSLYWIILINFDTSAAPFHSE